METPYLLKKVQEALTKNESLANSPDSIYVQTDVSSYTSKGLTEKVAADDAHLAMENLSIKSDVNSRIGVLIDWLKGSMTVLY